LPIKKTDSSCWLPEQNRQTNKHTQTHTHTHTF